MILSAFRTAVRTRLGNPSTDGFFTDANLTELLREATMAYSTETDWPWLTVSTTFPTVAGTAAYTPTAGWQKTRVLCIDGYEPMNHRSLTEIRAIPSTDRGRPTLYAVSGEQIILRDVPDAIYTVTHDYIKTETAMTGDSDVLFLPAVYDDVVIAYAAHLAHKRQRDNERSAMELADYALWIKRMLDNQRRTSAPRRVRIRPGRLI